MPHRDTLTHVEEAEMRAREPDLMGTIERDGVRIGYDVYG
jgi:hypothetical protein